MRMYDDDEDEDYVPGDDDKLTARQAAVRMLPSETVDQIAQWLTRRRVQHEVERESRSRLGRLTDAVAVSIDETRPTGTPRFTEDDAYNLATFAWLNGRAQMKLHGDRAFDVTSSVEDYDDDEEETRLPPGSFTRVEPPIEAEPYRGTVEGLVTDQPIVPVPKESIGYPAPVSVDGAETAEARARRVLPEVVLSRCEDYDRFCSSEAGGSREGLFTFVLFVWGKARNKARRQLIQRFAEDIDEALDG